MASTKKVDGVLDQWFKDNIPWMRAQHGVKGFKFQNIGELNSKACKDLVAASVGKLITNCPHSPETMSIIERSWRTIGEVATVMLLPCGLAENFCEEATLYAGDNYSRVPPAMPNKAGLRQSPFQRLHGKLSSVDELRPFGCRGFAFIPIRGKAHKKRSEQVIFIRKEFGKIRGLGSSILLLTPLESVDM